MYVKPTLFIGIGTSGAEILQQIRRFIFEEFQVAALPCFSYVALETNISNKAEDAELPNLDTMQPEEKIHMVPIGIPDVSIFRETLRNARNNQNWGDINKWLHPQLLSQSANNFTDGAGNIRMVGRLCLWYNWDKVTNIIRDRYNRILAPDASHRTGALLRSYLQQKGRENENVEIGQRADIYLVGTLCGGTCSGGFIDLGFYAVYILLGLGRIADLANWNREDSRVVGCFSITDDQGALQNNIYASNCYAALSELDYYNHDESTFEVIFPQQMHINAKNGSPFHWVDIISTSSAEAGINFHGFQEGAKRALHGMIAMNVFSDVISPVVQRKIAKRSDYPVQIKRYNQLSRSGYAHRLNSFGISAYWYPKQRLAHGVAAMLVRDFCTRLLGGVDQSIGSTHIERDAQMAIEPFLNTLSNEVLLDQKLGTDIKSEISHILTQHKTELKQLPLERWEQRLQNIPSDQPLPKQFGMDGRYSRLIRDRLPYFRTQIENKIAELRNQYGAQPIQFVNQLFRHIHHLLKQRLDRIPASMPVMKSLPSVSGFVSTLTEIENSNWLKMLGIPKKIRDLMIDRLINKAEQDYMSFLEQVRDFLLRDVLSELCNQLNPDTGSIVTNKNNQYNLEKCLQFCEDAIKMAQKTLGNENIQILVGNGGIASNEDMHYEMERIYQTERNNRLEHLQAEFCRRPPSEGGGEQQYTLPEFLQKDAQYIFRQMHDVAQRRVLRSMLSTNVADTLKDPKKISENHLQKHCSRSTAFLEFAPPFQDVPRDFPRPNLVAAKSLPDAENVRQRLGAEANILKETVDTGFEHLVVFYREEPMFSLEDTALHHNSRKFYDQALKANNNHCYGLHTNKDPLHFDVSYFLNINQLKQSFQLAHEILKNETFEEVNKKLCFVYYDIQEVLHTLSAEEFEPEFNMLAYAHRRYQREQFYKKIRAACEQLGQETVRGRLRDFLNKLFQTKNLDYQEQEHEQKWRNDLLEKFLN